MMVESFIIAASFPAGFLSFMYPNPMLPTIGASGMIYALLGRYAFSIEKIVKYNLWWAFFIGMGFLFPYANAPLHLYCYLCGFILALLNKPISL